MQGYEFFDLISVSRGPTGACSR